MVEPAESMPERLPQAQERVTAHSSVSVLRRAAAHVRDIWRDLREPVVLEVSDDEEIDDDPVSISDEAWEGIAASFQRYEQEARERRGASTGQPDDDHDGVERLFESWEQPYGAAASEAESGTDTVLSGGRHDGSALQRMGARISGVLTVLGRSYPELYIHGPGPAGNQIPGHEGLSEKEAAELKQAFEDYKVWLQRREVLQAPLEAFSPPSSERPGRTRRFVRRLGGWVLDMLDVAVGSGTNAANRDVTGQHQLPDSPQTPRDGL